MDNYISVFPMDIILSKRGKVEKPISKEGIFRKQLLFNENHVGCWLPGEKGDYEILPLVTTPYLSSIAETKDMY